MNAEVNNEGTSDHHSFRRAGGLCFYACNFAESVKTQLDASSLGGSGSVDWRLQEQVAMRVHLKKLRKSEVRDLCIHAVQHAGDTKTPGFPINPCSRC